MKKFKAKHTMDDGRQWCIVFEGDGSAMRAATAAMILRINDIDKFMLHEWKTTTATQHGQGGANG